MAKVFPDINTIKKMSPQPTEGEWFLLNYLNERLDKTYEIYFQAHVNGFFPDIVILRKNCGALIIEVKDWNLASSYRIFKDSNTNKTIWEVHSNSGDNQFYKVLSPIEQAISYKRNLYNIYNILLARQKLILGKGRAYKLVGAAVYFHNANINDIKLASEESDFVTVFCRQSLDSHDYLNSLMDDNHLSQINRDFTEDVYREFVRVLQPIEHLKEQGKEIVYNKEQKSLITSVHGKKQKIRGIAGSGKTKILARRAVNAYIRTRQPVLVLTFNITLRNYIHDMIKEVRENFSWDNFIVRHYHGFLSEYRNKHNLEKTNNVLSRCPQKYAAIFVDEAQDFEPDWIDTIHSLLQKDGELVFFGDEHQNIYDRKLDTDKRVYTKIGGRWRELKTSFRINNSIADLLDSYQKTFLKDKYTYDKINANMSLDFSEKQPIIKYYNVKNINPPEIVKIYRQFIEDNNIHDNDVCFLGNKIENLRHIEEAFINIGYRTTTTFENEALYNMAVETCKNNKKDLDDALYDYRRAKKFHFYMNSGRLKLSTTHSFKGWEINNVFLIVEPTNNEKISLDELIYTGLSRARQNIFVLEVGQSKYTDFFKEHMSIQQLETQETTDLPAIKEASSEVSVLQTQLDEKESKLLLEKQKQIALEQKIEIISKEKNDYQQQIEELSSQLLNNMNSKLTITTQADKIKILQEKLFVLQSDLKNKDIQLEGYEKYLNELTTQNDNQIKSSFENDNSYSKAIKELEEKLADANKRLDKKNESIIQNMDSLWKIHFPRFVYDRNFLKKVAKFNLDVRLDLEKMLSEINSCNDRKILVAKNRGKITKKDCYHYKIKLEYRLDFQVSDGKIYLMDFYHKNKY